MAEKKPLSYEQAIEKLESIIRRIEPPLLIIHSPDDDIIPFSHGRALLAEREGLPTEFLEIRGDHNYGWQNSGAVYVEGLRRFIGSALKTAGPGAQTESP